MLKKSPFDIDGRKDNNSSNRGELKAFLGEGTNFKGVLAFEGTVRIDGRLEGEIITDDTLIVGEKAIINAEINVGNIAINGKITGNIIAKERIDIHSSGEVYGNLKTKILTVEEGVIFQGHCEMRNFDEKKLPYVVGKEQNKSGNNKNRIREMSSLLTGDEPKKKRG